MQRALGAQNEIVASYDIYYSFYTEQNNKNNLIATMDAHKQSMFFKNVCWLNLGCSGQRENAMG